MYKREDIHGTSGQDLMKMNENFMAIFEKVFGDINFSDTANELQTKIMTQWIQVQGEGNLDSNYPVYIRFFIPPNVKTIKKTDFNFILENYRMDSSVTAGGGSFQTGDVSLNMNSATVGVASVSSESTTGSANGGFNITSGVERWGTSAPTGGAVKPYYAISDITNMYNFRAFDNNGQVIDYSTDGSGRGVLVENGVFTNISGVQMERQYVDLLAFQHTHTVAQDAHTHSIPSHSHSISMSPHSHTGTVAISIPNHEHGLTEGVKVSTVSPSNVNILINDVGVATFSGMTPINNLDLTQYLRIGEWNTIKVTTSNFARVVAYGTIEVVIKNTI